MVTEIWVLRMGGVRSVVPRPASGLWWEQRSTSHLATQIHTQIEHSACPVLLIFEHGFRLCPGAQGVLYVCTIHWNRSQYRAYEIRAVTFISFVNPLFVPEYSKVCLEPNLAEACRQLQWTSSNIQQSIKVKHSLDCHFINTSKNFQAHVPIPKSWLDL